MLTSLHGIWVPLATPMHHGEIDLSRLQHLAAVLEVAHKRCPVLMGIGGSDTYAAASRVLQFDDMELAEARELFARLLPLIQLMFSEPNPAPLKAALAMQGLLRDELRLPMTPATNACKARIATVLEALDTIPVYAAAEAI